MQSANRTHIEQTQEISLSRLAQKMAQQKLRIEWAKKLSLRDSEVSLLEKMGLHEMWRLLCAPMTGYCTHIIEQAIATYNVAEMTIVIDGCTIELTLEAIAKALKVPMEAASKGQAIEKEKLRVVIRVEYTN